jgi:imidazolonepropionase
VNVDLVIHNIGELVTLAGPRRARAGEEMGDIGILKSAAVAVTEGEVVETGPSKRILRDYQGERSIDAGGRIVMPGFVDCHTHLVHGGSRENELAMRMAGKSYLEILEAGGGIHSTVAATRKANEKSLARRARRNLDLALAHGTTCMEIKSGYGLEPDTELKILRVAVDLDEDHPIDIVTTFLGPHTIPQDMDREEYLAWCAGPGLQAADELAEYVDIFVEDGAYTLDEAQVFLEAAKARGFGLKVHGGQFNDLGAAGLAAELGAVSVDHLEEVSDGQIAAMAEAGTIGVMLPGAAYFLFTDYPDARRMIAGGMALALGTDFNPGSSPTLSMPLMTSMAVLQLKMSPEEAICAATINAAYACGRGEYLGSLEKGKAADLIILEAERAAQIPYYFGTNLVSTVVKDGEILLGGEYE